MVFDDIESCERVIKKRTSGIGKQMNSYFQILQAMSERCADGEPSAVLATLLNVTAMDLKDFADEMMKLSDDMAKMIVISGKYNT